MLEVLFNPMISLIILSLAILLDILYPLHKGILLKLHPVHTCYVLALKLAKPYATKAYGVLIWFICILIHLAPFTIFLQVFFMYFKYPWVALLWLIAVSWILKTCFSIRLLIDIGVNVYKCSIKGDWSGARYWTQQIVRRDVYKLDEEHVLSACIESIAESLVDGFVSPLFYYSLFSVWGSLIQRLANTLDGAIGFKTPELREIGWFSAKMDTILNFIPARLTALYIILSSLILGYNWRNALRIYFRDKSKTVSINAGHPMSAMAGALGVRLEKIGCYGLGDSLKPLEPYDVIKAIKIAMLVIAIHIMLTVMLIVLTHIVYLMLL